MYAILDRPLKILLPRAVNFVVNCLEQKSLTMFGFDQTSKADANSTLVKQLT